MKFKVKSYEKIVEILTNKGYELRNNFLWNYKNKTPCFCKNDLLKNIIGKTYELDEKIEDFDKSFNGEWYYCRKLQTVIPKCFTISLEESLDEILNAND